MFAFIKVSKLHVQWWYCTCSVYMCSLISYIRVVETLSQLSDILIYFHHSCPAPHIHVPVRCIQFSFRIYCTFTRSIRQCPALLAVSTPLPCTWLFLLYMYMCTCYMYVHCVTCSWNNGFNLTYMYMLMCTPKKCSGKIHVHVLYDVWIWYGAGKKIVCHSKLKLWKYMYMFMWGQGEHEWPFTTFVIGYHLQCTCTSYMCIHVHTMYIHVHHIHVHVHVIINEFNKPYRLYSCSIRKEKIISKIPRNIHVFTRSLQACKRSKPMLKNNWNRCYRPSACTCTCRSLRRR